MRSNAASRRRVRTARYRSASFSGATLNQPRPLGELGALKLTGVVRLNYERGREAQVTLDGLPVDPAHATLKHLDDNPLGLVRQLEHRVQDLDGLRRRLLTRQQEAAQEGARAREALAKQFKHTEALAAAERKLDQIEQQIRASQAQEVSVPPSASQSASTDDVWPRPGTGVPPPAPSWTPPPPVAPPHAARAALKAGRSAPAALRVFLLGSAPGQSTRRDALPLPNRRATARNRTRPLAPLIAETGAQTRVRNSAICVCRAARHRGRCGCLDGGGWLGQRSRCRRSVGWPGPAVAAEAIVGDDNRRHLNPAASVRRGALLDYA